MADLTDGQECAKMGFVGEETKMEVSVVAQYGMYTVTVAGQRVLQYRPGVTATTIRTNKRYAVVGVRPVPVKTEQGSYVAFAAVEKLTDNLATACKLAAKRELGPGVQMVVMDLVEGVAK